jgi:hypothetical protein
VTGRSLRPVLYLATAVILLLTLVQWAAYSDPTVLAINEAADFQLYHDATARWFHGGSFYEPYQVAGPYEVMRGDILYPPPALILFVPFLFLPAVLWWAIPIAVTIWAIVRLRPDPIAWPVMAICLWFPNTGIKLLTGNPVLWSLAAIALGTIYYWPAVFVAIKPTLAPIALFGSWTRNWWIAAAGFAASSLLFLPMWPDFIAVIRNARHPAGVLYSIGELPMLLIPVVAWLARPTIGPAHQEEAPSTR